MTRRIPMNIRVTVVGDRPSSKNTSPDIAFYGTRSMDTLAEWLFWIGLHKYQVIFINSHEDSLLDAIENHVAAGNVIVACGNNASSRLAKRGIEHFKLPHPSGRNRKLNDRNFIDSELEKCKTYLRGKDETGN